MTSPEHQPLGAPDPAGPTDPAPRAGAPAPPATYRGEPLDGARGPGLGCFRIQLALLVSFVILTPLTVAWEWPPLVSGLLLMVVMVLLLLSGQTVIFLLRLVASERGNGRRRPIASPTPTVGELEDVVTSPSSPAEPAPGTPGPGVRE